MASFIFEFSPEWFYGIDIIFEFLSALVCIAIAVFSFRLYKFSRKSSHKYFGLSFLGIAVSFFFKIMTNFVTYWPVMREETIGLIKVIYHSFEISYTPVMVNLIVFRILFLAGLFGIFYIVSKSQERNKIPFFLFFILVVSIFSTYTYHVFHITSIFILAFISYYYYQHHKSRKAKKSCCVFLSFLFLLISQIVFIFTFINLNAYVVAEVIQFFGFLILLYSYFLLQKVGSKKIKLDMEKQKKRK